MPKERRSRAWSVRLVLLAFSSRWARYPIAVTIIAIVVGIRAYVIPGWSLAHPYLLFYPAIMLAGWLGGFGPGVLATILAALSLAVLWLPPLYSLRIQRVEDASGLMRSEEHTSELQSPPHLVCRPLLGKKKKNITNSTDQPLSTHI